MVADDVCAVFAVNGEPHTETELTLLRTDPRNDCCHEFHGDWNYTLSPRK